jgi:carboxyl-terminal processing protease
VYYDAFSKILPKIANSEELRLIADLRMPGMQIENGIKLLAQAYRIIIEEHYRPVSGSTMLYRSMKGIEGLVGDTGCFILKDGHPKMINPLTQKLIDQNVTQEDGLQALKDIYRFVANNKPDYAPKDIAHSALGGMLGSLDPDSTFLPPEAFEDSQIDPEGKFTGIGINLTMRDDFVTVISPIDDSPAQKAGIMGHDRIIKVDGKAIKNKRQTLVMLRGQKGTKVGVTILRQGVKEPIEFEIVRDVIPIVSVKPIALKPGYGYIRISQFAGNTTKEFEKALTNLESGEGPLKGLVLDLRNNGGGLLNQPIKLADLFLEDGKIIRIQGRAKKNKKIFVATPNQVKRNYPIVVLINENSAASSEIFAGALQDNKRALVLGTKSFGNGSLQTVETLRDGSGLKLTIASCYTPSGRSIQTEAIVQDIVVKGRFISEKDIFYGDNFLFKEKGETKHLKIEERLGLDNQVRRALEVLVQTEE